MFGLRRWVVDVRLVTVVTHPATKSADSKPRQIHFFAIAARELHTAKGLVKVDLGKRVPRLQQPATTEMSREFAGDHCPICFA